MKRNVKKVGDALLVELTDELKRIGASDAVLVRVVDGDSPHLVISRPPSFEEAMGATLTDHADALRTLATVPDTRRAEGEA